jgi:PBP1b-binding outer membrane lipoprotein LpoB
MRNLKSLILITFLMISGCAHQEPKIKYVYVPLPLERPVRPDFPKVKGSDLSCVPNNTKQQLLMRDDVIKSYINRLEATIDATKVTDQ